MRAARNGPSQAIINHVDASGSQNRRMSRCRSGVGGVIGDEDSPAEHQGFVESLFSGAQKWCHSGLDKPDDELDRFCPRDAIISSQRTPGLKVDGVARCCLQ